MALSRPTLNPVVADIVSHDVKYKESGSECTGFVAYPVGNKAMAVVLVIQDWNGIDDYEKRRCKELAALGYLGFAVDVYAGVRPKNAAESSAEASKYYKDSALLMRRLAAGRDTALSLTNETKINTKSVSAIGYCFGGKAVLEMARAGWDLKSVVSFHGGLGTGNPAKAGMVKPKVLVLHGADDPFVPQKDVTAFQEEMTLAKANFKFVAYPDAVHSFTIPSEAPKSSGAAYNAAADKASWEEMRKWLPKP